MDYYEVLGVEKTATQDEIKKKHRNLAKKYHPDINKAVDAADRFKEIQAAYDTLGDEKKRRAYDAPNHGLNGVDFNSYTSWENIQRENTPYHHVAEIELSQTNAPINYHVSYERTVFCEPCQGQGGKNDGKQQKCPLCNGSGMHRIAGNFFTACQRCKQTGFIHLTICEVCGGMGLKKEHMERDILLPLGSMMTRHIFKESGNREDPRQPAGPLVVDITSARSPEFMLLENRVVLRKLKINPVFAMMGGSIKVKDVYGAEINCIIAQGTENKQVMWLPERGIYHAPGARGEMGIQMVYELPQSFTPAQTAALQQYLDAA